MEIIPLNEIGSEQWIKNWSGSWRTSFASLYLVYTKGLKEEIGMNLKKNLLICEKGVSSNYIAKSDLDTYGAYTAKLIIDDVNIATRWSEETVSTADQLFGIIKQAESKEVLTLATLRSLKAAFYSHVPPHFSMKKVVDYLPADLQTALIPQLTEARLKTEHLFNAVDGVLRSYAQLIAQESAYPEELTVFLTVEEMEKYFESGKLPTPKNLEERSNGLIIFCEGDTYTLLTGSEYEDVQKHLSGFSGSELKGSSAYKGKAEGTVRIVFDPFNVKEFNEGDVLVTGMTRPEFLPLMQKASAFVTDAGGVLSHAAIVARELGKPCVLATEKATKVLKNGDKVEVDGDRGIVRIINRG